MKYIKYVRENEPVRMFLYFVLAALVGTMVTKGWITDDIELLVLAGIGTLIGVPAVEAARAKVMPVQKVEAVVYNQVNQAVAEVQRQAQPTVDELIARANSALDSVRR